MYHRLEILYWVLMSFYLLCFSFCSSWVSVSLGFGCFADVRVWSPPTKEVSSNNLWSMRGHVPSQRRSRNRDGDIKKGPISVVIPVASCCVVTSWKTTCCNIIAVGVGMTSIFCKKCGKVNSCNDLVITIISHSPMKHDFYPWSYPEAASALGEVSKSGSAFAVSWSQLAGSWRGRTRPFFFGSS